MKTTTATYETYEAVSTTHQEETMMATKYEIYDDQWRSKSFALAQLFSELDDYAREMCTEVHYDAVKALLAKSVPPTTLDKAREIVERVNAITDAGANGLCIGVVE